MDVSATEREKVSRGASHAHARKLIHTPDIPFSACSDTTMHPSLFTHDLTIELVPLKLLLLKFFFWIFCFSMSRYSMYLERKLRTDHR